MKVLSRPIPVLVLGLLFLLSALSSVAATVLSARAGALPGALLLDGVIAFALFAIAWGLWKLQPWSWTSALAVQVIYGLIAILALTTAPTAAGPWIGLAIAALSIVLLLLPETRLAFGKARPRA